MVRKIRLLSLLGLTLLWSCRHSSAGVVQETDVSASVPQAGQPYADEWIDLLSLADHDPNTLDTDAKRRLAQRLVELGGRQDSDGSPIVLDLSSNRTNARRFVLLAGGGPVVIPGESRASVRIFDTEGNKLSTQDFSTGWRIAFDRARVVYQMAMTRSVIEILTNRFAGGRDVSRQFYALLESELVLIRLEDSSGQILRNSYQAKNWTIGPIPRHREPADWEASLRSDDPVDVLRALVWIGGEHCYPGDDDSTSPNTDPGTSIHKTIRSKPVNEVRAMPGVKRRLKELVRSKNKWIREAAELAIKPADDTTILR